MKRRLLVALFVTLLVVQPTTAATYPDAEAACGRAGGGEVLVGILPGGSNPTGGQVLTDRTRLYAGTTLRLALCKDGELKHTQGSEWALRSSPGIEVVNETDTTVTVTVTGEETEVDLPGLVSGKEGLDGVSVVVPSVPTTDSALVDETTIRFENASAASEYAAAEEAYLGALADHSNATDRLNESAAALKSGNADLDAVTEKVLPALNESRTAVENRRQSLESQLYETAWRMDGDSNALTVLSTVQTREQTVQTTEKHAMENYLERLETAEEDARSTALLNLVGAAVAGLVVGALPGWKLTASKLEAIRFDRQVNSSVNYGPRVLVRAVGLAVAAVVLTVVGVVALGGFETLGGLL